MSLFQTDLLSRGLSLLLWLSTLLAAFTTSVSAKPFIWRVRTNNSTVYLAGSIHVLRATDLIPMTYDWVYSQSDRLAFELDIDDARSSAHQSFVLANALYPSGQTIRGALSRTAYSKLQNFATMHGLSKTAFDRYRPWFVSGGISDFQDRDLGFRSRYGVDERYFRKAQTDSKPRLYLETIRDQVRALSRTPNAEWAAGIEPAIDDGGYSTARLVRKWRRGQVGMLAAQVDAGAIYYPNIYRAVLVERNKKWLPQVESYLTQSSTTMVVVGAAHLVGVKSLVTFLTARGYDILQMPGIVASNVWLTLQYLTPSNTVGTLHGSARPEGLVIAAATVARQSSFTLSVGASGDRPITYRWLKDGVPLVSQTNSVLRVDNVGPEHAGVYAVDTRNEFGFALPARCLIQVAEPPGSVWP